MNKSKGFTLIEVLGIVTILGILLIMAVPATIRTLKNYDIKKYDAYIESVKKAAENYAVENPLETSVTIKTLIEEKYISGTAYNPDMKQKLSEYSKVIITKAIDNTYDIQLKAVYDNLDEYSKQDLIVHYDSVEPYIPTEVGGNTNIFKSLTDEIDYDYSNIPTAPEGGIAQWTDDGVKFYNPSNGDNTLKNTYNTDSITVSFNIKSLDEIGVAGDSYTYPATLINNGTSVASFGFRKNCTLFYRSGDNSVFCASYTSFLINLQKNYTLTFVQDGLTTRKYYLNGVLQSTKSGLSLNTIIYNKIVIAPQLYNLLLHNVLIYNRALSDDEVADLYELDKNRFGE